MTYSVLAGNVIRFYMSFTNDAGTLTSPSDVVCQVGTASADVETLSVVNDSTGRYHADWDTTGKAAGDYYCQAIATGTLLAAKEIRVKIRESHLS